MWDKDTWPNNNGNTSVKLLWLFGLMERGHCWPSAGLKSITDMPSHMIRFVASGAAANTRFIYLFIFGHPRSRTVRCVERLVPPRAAQEWQVWLVLSRNPPHPIPSPEAIRVLKWGWKSQKVPAGTDQHMTEGTGGLPASVVYGFTNRSGSRSRTADYYIYYILLI